MRSETVTETPRARRVDMKLEVVVISVSDVNRGMQNPSRCRGGPHQTTTSSPSAAQGSSRSVRRISSALRCSPSQSLVSAAWCHDAPYIAACCRWPQRISFDRSRVSVRPRRNPRQRKGLGLEARIG
jgi:hypothetical protein